MAERSLASRAAGESTTPRDDGGEPSAPPSRSGWRCIAGAIIRAHGEEGPVDLVALNPDRGVALLGFVEIGEEADAGEAREAFAAMLDDLGFARRFSRLPPIVALTVPRDAVAAWAAVERTFDELPRPSLPAGWTEWLAARLEPMAPPSAPRAAAVASSSMAATVRARSSWLDWGVSLGFGFGIVLMLLLALALALITRSPLPLL